MATKWAPPQLRITTFSLSALSIMTVRTTTLNIMNYIAALILMHLIAIVLVNDAQYNDTRHK